MFLSIDSDNLVRLADAATVNMETGERTPLDAGATITFRLQTLAGIDVAGDTWPQTMHYIPGSEGGYLGLLRDSLLLTEHETYVLIAEADNGNDQHRRWRIPLLAVLITS